MIGQLNLARSPVIKQNATCRCVLSFSFGHSVMTIRREFQCDVRGPRGILEVRRPRGILEVRRPRDILEVRRPRGILEIRRPRCVLE